MAEPKLPTQDWAGKFSEHVHRQDEIRQLSADISRCGNRCGDCNNWMKSRQCPQERNVNGMSRGPSCEGRICGSFAITNSAAARRKEMIDRRKALTDGGKDEPATGKDRP